MVASPGRAATSADGESSASSRSSLPLVYEKSMTSGSAVAYTATKHALSASSPGTRSRAYPGVT